MTGNRSRNMGVLALGLAAAFVLSVPADARRGGSFGSRGARTYDAPAATNVAPRQAAPVERSMAQRPPARPQANAAGAQQQPRRGGFAGPLIGGLLAGGLIGALLGGGLGSLGGSGMLFALLQIALIGGLVWLAFRLFRRRPAVAAGPQSAFSGNGFGGAAPNANQGPFGGFGAAATPAPTVHEQDIPIDDADRAAFERLLTEVQDAFGREDYAALRARTTPEVMSFFAEELGQNAASGRRNQVSGTRLLDAEVAEAWSEGAADYATIAMRYESIDVMVDRTSGAVIEGDPARPSTTTELWTFTRANRADWRLSAIQQA